MKLLSNDWAQIREHYEHFAPRILAQKANEWATDPYAWSGLNLNMTPIESWLWESIRLMDMVAYPQYPVLGYFVDFANPRAKVAIECDGADYHTDWRKDEARDAELAAAGWTVYRITGAECGRGSDREEAALSYADEFIRRICIDHGASRHQHAERMHGEPRWYIRPPSTSTFGRARGFE